MKLIEAKQMLSSEKFHKTYFDASANEVLGGGLIMAILVFGTAWLQIVRLMIKMMPK